ncbi:MAG: recombinase family protein [Epsilonproteobacteria bacterium]|nr:recombinase family protein [Campylobacterota bacterium]
MNYIYLRSKSDRFSLALQEKNIKDYMALNGYEINSVEIEVSSLNRTLDERVEFKAFMHSLEAGDRIFVYDLRALSQRIGELIQIFNCIFEHKIELIVTRYGVRINKETPSHVVVSLLNQQREENKNEVSHTGRPKGSISKSKYDVYREKIIQMIKEGKNVSEIAKALNVNRSSIRDYINSRELKKIALGGVENVKVLKLPENECKIKQKG